MSTQPWAALPKAEGALVHLFLFKAQSVEAAHFNLLKKAFNNYQL